MLAAQLRKTRQLFPDGTMNRNFQQHNLIKWFEYH